MKKTATFFAILILLAGPASAATRYVTDLMEITVRSGPGLKYRVTKTIESGQAVEVLETGDEWTRIALADGSIGWAVSRYLVEEQPESLEAKSLKERIEPMETEIQTLKAENDRLITMNQEMADELEKRRQGLEEVQSAYDALKADSGEFLNLKAQFQAATADLNRDRQRIDELQTRLSKANLSAAVKWFLAGAGVLILGMILGSRSKRKRAGLR